MDPATLFAQLDALTAALRDLDGNDVLEADTLSLIADLRLAAANERRAVERAIEAEMELSPDYDCEVVDGQTV